MRIVLKRARHFITCGGRFYGSEREGEVRSLLSLQAREEKYEQLSLFSLPEIGASAQTGQL